ncbi:MAG: zinc ribbon domain-containing protein [Thermoplasmata archaeon]|nr:zinc ribbon domain-containing protein [Thermoplasmata archaeon]
MVDSGSVTLVIGISVLSVLLIAFLLYTRQTMRRRSKQLRMELDERPSAKDDRAFNQIRISSAEADVLERTGVEVVHARELLADAQRAYDRHDWDTALRQARSAHESLVALRGRAPLRLPSVLEVSRSRAAGMPATDAYPAMLAAPARPGPSGPGSLGSAAGSGDASSPGARLPKNRAESHFQMTLLAEEIARATAADGSDGRAKDAEQIRSEAQGAYSRGDYTEALRLSLRGRRRIGGRLETLPPTRSTQSESLARTPEPGTPTPHGGPEPTGKPSTCSRCGKAVRASDQFCRGCGATLKSSLCPRCGQPLQPEDAFCAGCGAPVAP